MKALKTLCIAALVALLTTISFTLFAQEKSEDAIEIQIGNTVRRIAPVKISSETYKVVRYGIGEGLKRSWQSEPTENVVLVEHGDRPQRYIDAESDLEQGEYESAIEKYRTCIKFEEQKEWVKPYSTFYIAECFFYWAQTDPSKFEEALKSYENFIAQFPDHRFVPAAWQGKAECAKRLKKSQIVQESYEQMAKGEFGLKYKYLGEVGLAQIDMAQGKTNQALDRIKKISADPNAQKVPGVIATCRLLLAKGQVAIKRYDEAIRNLKEIVSNPEGVGKEVMATAHNLLGDCYRELGSTQDMERALLEYLKVVLLYRELEPEYARALPRAIELAESLGGDTYKDVIRDLKEEAKKLQR